MLTTNQFERFRYKLRVIGGEVRVVKVKQLAPNQRRSTEDTGFKPQAV